jgi:cation:H+ antiporter
VGGRETAIDRCSAGRRPDDGVSGMTNRNVMGIAIVVAATLPWMAVWLTSNALPALGIGAGIPHLETWLSTGAEVVVSGVSILGASFLLAWGAETAEKDVPRAFAIAVLAVLAVAPEYAVDALYAWNAGAYAGTERGIEAGNLAVANMTGANRILIGIGWAGIALFTVWRARTNVDSAVVLDRDIGLEIVFLLAATSWAFLVPLNGGIDILDMAVLVGIYVVYIAVVIRGDVDPHLEHVGVPAYLQRFRKPRRIATVLLLFAYSGLVIFVAVEPFAHGLEEIGQAAGIPSFFMIQWVAPLASESPELIVVVYLVNKARSTAGFNALISSKLNQWTLLIGTLSVVFSLAYGQYGVLPFDGKQAAEIWITAAQSYFALAVLVNFEISVREAVVIFALFISQVLIEFAIIREWLALPLANPTRDVLLIYTAVYVVLGTALFVYRRQALKRMLGLAADAGRTAVGREPVHPEFGD